MENDTGNIQAADAAKASIKTPVSNGNQVKSLYETSKTGDPSLLCFHSQEQIASKLNEEMSKPEFTEIKHHGTPGVQLNIENSIGFMDICDELTKRPLSPEHTQTHS